MLDITAIKTAKLEDNPYSHTIINKLFSLDTVNALIAELPSTNNKRALRNSGSDKQYSVINNHILPLESGTPSEYLSNLWKFFVSQFQSNPYLSAVSELLSLDLTHCSLEITLKSYLRGDFISPHTDRSIVPATHILFLNPHWEQDWGGEFCIMKNKHTNAKTILPIWDRSVIFKQSPCSWHAVRPCVTDIPRLGLQIAFWSTNEKPLLEGRQEYEL